MNVNIIMYKNMKTQLKEYKNKGVVCVPLQTNSKIPIIKKNITKTPNDEQFENKNVGILLGKTFNITVIRVDVNGLNEINKINKYELPIKTLTTTIPNGGSQFYFLYDNILKHYH